MSMNDYTDYLAHFGTKGQKWGLRKQQSYQVAPTRSGMVGQEVGEAAKQTARLNTGRLNSEDTRKYYNGGLGGKMLNAAGEQYNRDQIQKYKDDAKKLISKKDVDEFIDVSNIVDPIAVKMDQGTRDIMLKDYQNKRIQVDAGKPINTENWYNNAKERWRSDPTNKKDVETYDKYYKKGTDLLDNILSKSKVDINTEVKISQLRSRDNFNEEITKKYGDLMREYVGEELKQRLLDWDKAHPGAFKK